jgi:hypothetical protein
MREETKSETVIVTDKHRKAICKNGSDIHAVGF